MAKTAQSLRLGVNIELASKQLKGLIIVRGVVSSEERNLITDLILSEHVQQLIITVHSRVRAKGVS